MSWFSFRKKSRPVEPSAEQAPAAQAVMTIEAPSEKRRPPKKKKKRLKDEDVPRFVDIADFRHITVEPAFVRYGFREQDTVYKWLQRQSSGGLLKSYPFVANKKYWKLTRNAVNCLKDEHGIHISTRSVFVPTTRLTEYHAFLRFCSKPGVPPLRCCRPHLLADEFPEIHAEYVRPENTQKREPLYPRLFYFDEARGVLGVFRLDSGRPDHVENDIRPEIQKLYQYPSIGQRAYQDLLELTVVATNRIRHTELSREFKDNPPPFPYSVELMPELEDVQVFQSKRKPSRRKKGIPNE